jgi:hypothetical protein
MEAMRESWTDKRLDEFRESTERRFDHVDHQLEAIDQRFDAVDQRFVDADKRFEMFEGNVKEGFDRVDRDLREIRGEMAAFHRVLLQLCGGVIATVAAGFAGLILTHL